jgi:hypothetical protein
MPQEADFLIDPADLASRAEGGNGRSTESLARMDKSRMLTASAALGFCVAGISIVHAESSEVSCGKFAWPHYPQQCLIKSDLVGGASAIVRVAVANPLAESATPDKSAPPVDRRFDDRNYFGPTPTYVEHLGPAALPASFFKG